jgi:hypothetical protein
MKAPSMKLTKQRSEERKRLNGKAKDENVEKQVLYFLHFHYNIENI